MATLFSMTALAFLGIALAGMFAHAVKKWVYGEIRGNLVDWYITHPQASVGALLSCLGGLAVALLTDTLHNPNAGADVLAAFGIGFTADTLNNQGKKL